MTWSAVAGELIKMLAGMSTTSVALMLILVILLGGVIFLIHKWINRYKLNYDEEKCLENMGKIKTIEVLMEERNKELAAYKNELNEFKKEVRSDLKEIRRDLGDHLDSLQKLVMKLIMHIDEN